MCRYRSLLWTGGSDPWGKVAEGWLVGGCYLTGGTRTVPAGMSTTTVRPDPFPSWLPSNQARVLVWPDRSHGSFDPTEPA